MKRILRRIIRYTNLFFAILLVLSFLSPNINPAKFSFPSFLGLAYPYILDLNLLFMLFWIFYRKREFVISFLAILLGWNTLTQYFSLNPSSVFRKGFYEAVDRRERAGEKQVKVMSFNVRAFNLYQWSDQPNLREEIFGLFRKNNPDVICLQEYYSNERGPITSQDIIEALEDTPYRYIHAPLVRGRSQYGLAIFSHYPIVGTGQVELNNPLSLCSYADVLLYGDTVRVYNMHLQSIRLSSQHYRFIDSLKFRYDNQQMEEIRDISTRLKDAFVKRSDQADVIAGHMASSPLPVIACGDFNDTPVSYAYRKISSGMQDAFVESGWGVGQTYSGKFPSFRIDYILVDQAFEAVHFIRKKVRLSDHFPVTAFLKLREDEDPMEQIRGWVKQD